MLEVLLMPGLKEWTGDFHSDLLLFSNCHRQNADISDQSSGAAWP